MAIMIVWHDVLNWWMKSSHSLFSTVIDIGGSKEKPVKHGVEVQTQTCDFVDLTSAKSQKEQERSRVDRKEKRYLTTLLTVLLQFPCYM